jgi:hypothetical protein
MFRCCLGIFQARARLFHDEGVEHVPSTKEAWHRPSRELGILPCYLMRQAMFGKQEESAYLVRQVEECQSGLINQRRFPEGAA